MDNNLLGTTFASGLGDNSIEVIPIGTTNVTKFKARFSSSGAIDDLEYCTPEEEVPEFGVLATGFVLALAGLFIYKKRKA